MEAELPDTQHLNQAEIVNPQLFAPVVEYSEHQLIASMTSRTGEPATNSTGRELAQRPPVPSQNVVRLQNE